MFNVMYKQLQLHPESYLNLYKNPSKVTKVIQITKPRESKVEFYECSRVVFTAYPYLDNQK